MLCFMPCRWELFEAGTQPRPREVSLAETQMKMSGSSSLHFRMTPSATGPLIDWVTGLRYEMISTSGTMILHEQTTRGEGGCGVLQAELRGGSQRKG